MSLALCFVLGSAWLGVAGPRELAAQLVPLGPEVDLRRFASKIEGYPLGSSTAPAAGVAPSGTVSGSSSSTWRRRG